MTIDNVEPLCKFEILFLFILIFFHLSDNYSNKNVTAPQNCMMESYAGTNAIVIFSNLGEFMNHFENNTKINPKVIEDIAAIVEKLPCNIFMFRELNWVVNIKNAWHRFEFNLR